MGYQLNENETLLQLFTSFIINPVILFQYSFLNLIEIELDLKKRTKYLI